MADDEQARSARRAKGPSTTPVRSRSFALRYGPIAAVAVFVIGAALVVSGRDDTKPLASTLQSASTESLSVPGAGSRAPAETAAPQLLPEHTAKAEPATVASRSVSPNVAEPPNSASAKSPTPKASTMAEAALSRDMAQAMTAPSASRSKIAVEPVFPPTGVAAGTGRLDAPLSTISLAPRALVADTSKSLAQVLDSAPPAMTGASIVSTTQSIENVSHVRRTVFQLESGVTVTLTERRSLTPQEAASVKFDTATSAASIVLRARSSHELPSVMWMGRDGAILTLSGPLPMKELHALKERIVE